jgi:hypothetical protein
MDLLLTVVENRKGFLHSGRSAALDLWDLTKAILITIGLLRAAVKYRSWGFASFASAVGLIGITDQVAWHGEVAGFVENVLDLEGVLQVHPAVAQGIAESLVLFLAAVIVALLIWSIRDPSDPYRLARRELTLLLVSLTLFAVVVDAIDHLTSLQTSWSLVEESGERLFLSAIGAYVAGLWAHNDSARSYL